MNATIERSIARQLDELLKRVTNGQPVDADAFDALKRSMALADLARSRRVSHLGYRLIAALALVTLIALSILLFARVSSTEIDLEAHVTDVAFTISQEQPLLGTTRLAGLSATNLGRIELPEELKTEGSELAASPEGQCLAQVMLEGSQPASTLSLNSLTVPAGTRVFLSHLSANTIKVQLAPPPSAFVRVDVSAKGSVETVARCPGAVVKGIQSFDHPRLFQFVGAPAELVSLELTTLPEAPLSFMTPFDAADLELSRVDTVFDGARSLDRTVSSVLRGTLYLEALNGRTLNLRSREPLRFDRWSGVMRDLTLAQRQEVNTPFAIHSSATVYGLNTGPRSAARNLMPTYLEWLTARRGLALLWGSTLYVTGLTVSLMRWLKLTQ